MMQDAQAVSGVPSSILDSAPTQSRFSKGIGLKKGGAAKHDDVKQDMALIKKMVKPEARKGKMGGGASLQDAANRGKYFEKNPMSRDEVENMRREAMEGYENDMAAEDQSAYRKRGGRAARKEGGGVFTGPGYPGKVPGVTGGRIARATGGKTKGKGKTNINILISAGQKQPGMDEMMPPPGMGKPPGGMPIPVPPPAPGGMPVGAPPPMPAPMPPMGGMPTPRKAGGRLTKVAHSYKDMEAGAGSGEGRLQKTDIAKARMGRKAGGKTYRSYKDMDAGAGSGFGRLEKAEIQKHKG